MFADRRDAGRRLAARLTGYAGRPDTIVLAVPRGGVIVGHEIARALEAPLDVIVPRELRAPNLPAATIGELGDPERTLLVDRGATLTLGVTRDELRAEVARQVTEIRRLYRLYRASEEMPEVTGKVVIVVDEGIAGWFMMRAALEAIRRQGPARLILAVPVAERRAIAMLGSLVDEVVCLAQPTSLGAVRAWYADFPPVSDEEVGAMLRAAMPGLGAAEDAGESRPRREAEPARELEVAAH